MDREATMAESYLMEAPVAETAERERDKLFATRNRIAQLLRTTMVQIQT